jgi:hypothetical protein
LPARLSLPHALWINSRTNDAADARVATNCRIGDHPIYRWFVRLIADGMGVGERAAGVPRKLLACEVCGAAGTVTVTDLQESACYAGWAEHAPHSAHHFCESHRRAPHMYGPRGTLIRPDDPL